MICPRCGEEYKNNDKHLNRAGDDFISYWCDACSTWLHVDIHQDLLNRKWHKMDMGGLHWEAAKATGA